MEILPLSKPKTELVSYIAAPRVVVSPRTQQLGSKLCGDRSTGLVTTPTASLVESLRRIGNAEIPA